MSQIKENNVTCIIFFKNKRYIIRVKIVTEHVMKNLNEGKTQRRNRIFFSIIDYDFCKVHKVDTKHI